MPLSDDQRQTLLDGYAAAKKRLRFAQQDVKEMEANYGNFDAYERSWISFLMNSNSFFSKLEQSVMVSLHAKAWLALVKNRRKHSEVMKYLQQARNSDQHSISQSVHLPRLGQKVTIKVKVLSEEEAKENALHRAELVKLIPEVGQSGYPMLEVSNRQQTYAPPKYYDGLFLGSLPSGNNSRYAAHLAIAFMSEVVDEYDRLSKNWTK